jgi:HEC/Ndc80p family.
MWSLTLKMFAEYTSHLLSHFFPKYVTNMSNYADEIPLLTKKLGYPGSVNSWLITANSCHSWPNVVESPLLAGRCSQMHQA